MFNRKYSLRKCKKVMYHAIKWYRKKKKKLSEGAKLEIENKIKSLEAVIAEKNLQKARSLTSELEIVFDRYLKKSPVEKFVDFLMTLGIALIVAICVRQMWFENYTIPSGSMRPTLKEKDFLIVSKTDFAINTPTRTGYFYFDKNLVKRGSVVILTTANMDVPNSDHMYFYIFPGKKQFVKRLIAKPGDTIYFYGGKLYGLDKDGTTILEYAVDKWFTDIEHIPFIRFDGRQSYVLQDGYNDIIISQMNTPLAKLSITGNNRLLTNEEPPFAKNFAAKNYYDIWGFKNYAQTRIISKKQAEDWGLLKYSYASDAPYFLELQHHPFIKKMQLDGRFRPSLSVATSLIPLDEAHMEAIFNNMYTSRFKVKNKVAFRIGIDTSEKSYAQFLPQVDLPDGCYEFQNGIAYSVNILGITSKLPKTHPIYSKSLENIVFFYNLGIEMNNLFLPTDKNQTIRPSRYSYFRDGGLYLLGSNIFPKDDPVLKSFVEFEKKKDLPFEDYGEPLINNEIDKDLIYKYGLRIPDDYYLVLGDNHAVSSDSRDWGFVPEKNLRGCASFIYWPFGDRFGRIFQPATSWFVLPKIVIWLSAIIIGLCFYLYFRRKNTLLK